jgi:3-oxoacyl-[acyl-carrier protein] reductase
MNAAAASLTQLSPSPGARVVVVGGCGGIGRAVVGALCSVNCEVAVLDLAASLEKYPPPQGAFGLSVDATSESSVSASFAEIDKRWGAIACLINLCGYKHDLKPIEAFSTADWDDGIAGNLRSAFLVSRAAVPLLKKAGGGTIVHVSSAMGTQGREGYGPYAAAKGAINAMAKTMARENAPAIRVNIVAPGLVDTAFIRGGTGRSDENQTPQVDIESYQHGIPLKRVAVAEDIVGPILFLAGPASRYMTGQILYVNGGSFMP